MYLRGKAIMKLKFQATILCIYLQNKISSISSIIIFYDIIYMVTYT